MKRAGDDQPTDLPENSEGCPVPIKDAARALYPEIEPYERGELRLQAERRASLPEGAQSLAQERFTGTITRRLMLGDQLDTEHVDADYAAGVLTLRIPLSEAAKPRRVEVRSQEQKEQTAISV